VENVLGLTVIVPPGPAEAEPAIAMVSPPRTPVASATRAAVDLIRRICAASSFLEPLLSAPY